MEAISAASSELERVPVELYRIGHGILKLQNIASPELQRRVESDSPANARAKFQRRKLSDDTIQPISDLTLFNSNENVSSSQH